MLRSPDQPLGLMTKLELPNRTLRLCGLLSALFIWSYWPTLVETVKTWRSDPDYSHGFLVLPISLAIWMRRREQVKELAAEASVLGLSCIALASLLRIVAARYYLMPLDAWSIPLWLGGVLWTFGGRRTIVRALPAVAFLWFAAPLPERVEELLSLPLQAVATAASGWVLQLLCQPAVAAGTTLLLGPETFEVEHACSGLRMFFGTFAMATAFVLLGGRGPRVNVLLILLAAPIALLTNVLRIVTTALLFQHASTEMFRRFVHDFAGLMMVGAVFGFYALVLYTIGRVTRAYQSNRDRFFYLLPVWTVTALAMLIVAFLWQQRQERRVLATLLDTAAYYEKLQDWRRAADYLDRYLQLHRDDELALSRLARAVDRSARTVSQQRRALTLLTAASKANPQDLDLASRQAELAWELRQLGLVISTTSSVLQHGSIDRPEYAAARQLAARLRAWAMYESLSNSEGYSPFAWRDVADALKTASQWDASNPQHTFRLAIVYRERLNSPGPDERAKLADNLIDGLVQERPDSAEAWLIRYRYRRRFQPPMENSGDEVASIDADLERALTLDASDEPRNVHILVASAERMRERGDMDASLALYQTALQANARDVRPYLAIADIWTQRNSVGAREKAVDVLQQGLAIIGSDEVPLMFPLIEQLIVLNRDDEANAIIAQAERAMDRFPDPVRTTYRIQLQHVTSWRLAKGGDYVGAAQSLENLVAGLAPKYVHSSGHYVAQSWANVGQYYRMAAEWDRASEAYQRAAALDDVWRLEYRWTLARQSEVHGDLSEAAAQYREIASRSDQSLNAWIQAASVALRQQVLLPESMRDWTHFRFAIEAARPVAGDDIDQLIVLEANQLLVVGQDERVVRLLIEAIKEYPESNLLVRSLALVQARRGDLEGALRTAEFMNPISGDPLASILLRKELLCDANRYESAIELLEGAARTAMNSLPAERPEKPESADSLNTVERPHDTVVALQLELAWLYLQRARWDEARYWMDEAKAIAPRDLRVIESLSELAWCREDWEQLEECESLLRDVEGAYGPLWRTLRIRRLLAQSPNDHPETASTAEEIDQLARQLEVLYPHIQQSRIAAGRVATYRGLLRRAVANYEEAWELGLPRVSLAVDLVGLLNELGETDRAQRYVREVRTYLTATRDVIDQSFLDLENESASEAIRMAEALAQDSPRSDSYLRLGRTLVLTALPQDAEYEDRLQRAEAAFRRAVELNPTDIRAWAALFRYLVAVKSDPVESQAVFRSLAERNDITPLNRAFVLAQLHESIENHIVADQLYRQSLQLAQLADPAERLIVLERVAQYFRRIDPPLSEQCCREALAIDESSIGPRQILLELLLVKRSREAAFEAKQIVESLGELGLSSDGWKRLQARVLVQASTWEDDPTGARRNVIELLESVTNKTSGDALLLSELYFVSGQQPAAITQLRTVAKQLPVDGAEVLRFLKQFDKQLYSDARSRSLAEQIYDQLEEQPDYGLTALDLRCEVAVQRGEGSYDQRRSIASSLIHRFVRRAIERAETEQDQFHKLVSVMRHLVATGRWEEAQQLTQLTPSLLPVPRPAAALATALATYDPTSEYAQLAAPMLDSWLVNHPNDPEMLFAVANLRLLWDEKQEAIELFRRSLALFPHHTATMNNLAIALATDDAGQLNESMQLVGEAIELEGRKPQWLDTLAVLHLQRGEHELAVGLLLEALPNYQDNDLLFLHLAKAWTELGDHDMARFALDLVESSKLRDRILTPLDRRMYEDVVGQLRGTAL
jgi:exosortase